MYPAIKEKRKILKDNRNIFKNVSTWFLYYLVLWYYKIHLQYSYIIICCNINIMYLPTAAIQHRAVFPSSTTVGRLLHSSGPLRSYGVRARPLDPRV